MIDGAGRLRAALEPAVASGEDGLAAELLEALVEAEVFVPGDAAGEWQAAGETSHGRVLVAFTDRDALQRWSEGQAHVDVRRAVEVVAVALEGGAQALAIDPGTKRALVLTRRGLLQVAEEVVRRGPAVDPPPLPPSPALLDGLRDLVERHPQVTAVYLYAARAADPCAAAPTRVGLEAADDASAASEDAAEVVADQARRGGEVTVLDWEEVLRVRTVAPPIGAGGPVERAAAAIRSDERARTGLFDALVTARLLIPINQATQDEDPVVPRALDVGGRSYVPVFTSPAAAQHTRPPVQLRWVAGENLSELVSSGAWLVLDPGCYHTLELGPDAVARISARGSGARRGRVAPLP